MMNWLDLVLLLILAVAAWKGFRRGFIVELASLAGLVLGIWAGIHLSERAISALELEVNSAAVAFLITFGLVIALVVLIGHGLTKLIDLADLSLPNKIAGVAFGVLRSAFTLSIALNLLQGFTEGRLPPEGSRVGSSLHQPMCAFAPLVVPALSDAKWMEKLKNEVEDAQEVN